MGEPACRAEKHGTGSAYRNWGCRCPSAREANRLYCKRRKVGVIQTTRVGSIGLLRRRQDLATLGYGLGELADALGLSLSVVKFHTVRSSVNRPTYLRWREMYERLSMTPGPNQRARDYARIAGWAPPLAWDDDTIDDPAAEPNVGERSTSKVDLADVVHLELGGCHPSEIARRMGVSEAYLRDLRNKSAKEVA